MPTLEEQLTASRDRITDILTSKKPDVSSPGELFLHAVTSRKSYGDVLNELKANRLAEQKTLFDVLAGHKRLQQEDRALGVREEELFHKKYKMALDRGDAAVQAAEDAINAWVVNDADKAKVRLAMQNHPEQITPQNASRIAAQVIEEERKAGRISQVEAQKPSTSMQKVYDEKSPTGWSWVSPSGERLPGAPPPGQGQSFSVTMPDGTQVTVGQPTAAQAGKHTIELEDQRVNVINLAKQANRLLTQLEKEGAGTLSFTGAVERLLDSTVAQTKAFIAAWGDSGKISKWVKEFKWEGDLAAQSAAVKSKIVSMAYGLALAKNGTRPTDQDVEFALQMIGTSGSVKQMKAAVNSLLVEAVDSYSTRHLEATQKPWNWDKSFAKHGLPVPQPTASLEFIRKIEGMTDEELLDPAGLQNLETNEEVDAWMQEMADRGLI